MKKKYNITLYPEKNIGYAASFWNLLNRVNSFDYYAFCDQDDIWLDEKISSAISLIEKETKNDYPVLYTSKVISVNNDGKILSKNTFNNNDKLNVYESFQKSKFPGCVFVFNNSARDCLIKYDGYMESHDWATYCIISVFGKTIFDDTSYIHYRIHENNAIGKKNRISEFLKKIKRFFSHSKCSRSKFAKDFYNVYKNEIPKEYLDDIFQLAFYKKKLKYRIMLFKNRNFKGFIFKFYVLIGKI